MNYNTYPNEPVPLSRAARCLRVPTKWLQGEVDAGRLPHLRAGKVILIHVPTVGALLLERTRHGEGVGDATK